MPTEAHILDAEKLKTINRYLLDEFVLVHVNPLAPEVVLPEHLKGHPTVTLKLSRLFRGTLDVKTDRIQAELLFGQDYFECVLPFNAIWGISTFKGENVIWGQSAPQIRTQESNSAATTATSPAAKTSPTTSKAPFLRRVK